MICEHLKQLYDHCEKHEIRLSSSDAIRIMCNECQNTDVCPSVLTDEYDARKELSSQESAGGTADSEGDS